MNEDETGGNDHPHPSGRVCAAYGPMIQIT